MIDRFIGSMDRSSSTHVVHSAVIYVYMYECITRHVYEQRTSFLVQLHLLRRFCKPRFDIDSIMAHELLGQLKAAEKYVRGQVNMGLSSLEEACATQVQHLSDFTRTNKSIWP